MATTLPREAHAAPDPEIRHDWTQAQALALFDLPFNDLIFRAQAAHRAHFDPNAVQLSTLLSIKTGGCPEDCAYCPQSAHYDTGLEREALLGIDRVTEAARRAKDAGASRFCMGAAWRSPTDAQLAPVCEMIGAVKALGMETCVTLGMLTGPQAARLAEAGLDYYNHNIDTSEAFYGEIISTRRFSDRLDTLSRVRDAGIHVCSGGIVGMGEGRADRAAMLATLASLPRHPESVPVNRLVAVAGTPLEGAEPVDGLEFVRTIAAARVMMPASVVRLSAGREDMTDEMQALCFLAGANSIFYGDMLLTTENPASAADKALFDRLGLHPMDPSAP